MSTEDVRHGPWLIWYEPPPIPIRTNDWQFVHDAYDGPGGRRRLTGSAPSVEDALQQIAEIEADEADWQEHVAAKEALEWSPPKRGGTEGGPVAAP
jgi:hypothetical protein